MGVLGERLKELRESKGWTQKYVAEKLGIKQSSTYANWEYGLRDPDTDMLAKIADLYEVQTDYLLGRYTYDLNDRDQTETIIKELVEKYDINLQQKGKKQKLEDLIKIVFDSES